REPSMALTRTCPEFRRAVRHPDRRSFVKAGVLGSMGLSLADLFRAEARATPGSTRQTSVIILWMRGGPAHQDTWDPKPNAPVEYRGEFRPIATATPGVQVCEHLPRLARMTDRLAIIRSMSHTDVDHTTGTHFLLTGRGVSRPGAP